MDKTLADTLTANLKNAKTPEAKLDALVLAALPLTCFAEMSNPAAARVECYLKLADEMQWTDTEKAKLTALVDRDSENMRQRRQRLAAEKSADAAAAPKVDPTLEQLRRDAQRRRARFEVLKRTQTAYEPGRTNLNVRAMRASLAEKIAEARQGWTNATLRIEMARAGLSERRAEYVSKRDSAALPTTKAIYQAFIDGVDALLAKLDEK